MTQKSHRGEGDDWDGSGRKYANSFLAKIGKIQSAGCRLCRIARDARGESTDGLAAETYGHMMMMIAFTNIKSTLD